MSTFSWKTAQVAASEAIKPLDPGTYTFKVRKADARVASTGSNMISATLEVIGGPRAGKAIMNNFVISTNNPMALAMFFRNMAAFGIDDAFVSSLPDDLGQGAAMIAAALVDRLVDAEVNIRTTGTYKGRNDFVSFSPASAFHSTVTQGMSIPSPGAGLPGATPSIGAGAPPIPIMPTPTTPPPATAATAPDGAIPPPPELPF